MKVNIGPYVTHFGIYQLTGLLKYFRVSEETCNKLAEKLEGTFIDKFLTNLNDKRNRKVKIKLHKYDTWNMDHTLALIILPMLKQLKETKHGAFVVDMEDVPENLRLSIDPEKYGEDDNTLFDRCYWAMDEMIWTFEQLLDEDNESKFYTPKKDANGNDLESGFVEGGVDENGEKWYTFESNTEVDEEGLKQHNERIKNGLRLFGKYYRGLWD